MKIEKYDFFEFVIPETKGAALLEDCAVFSRENIKIQVKAFKNGEDSTVRFMPQETGEWHYEISLCGKDYSGDFECVENTGNNNGPVVTQDEHFVYVNGAKYIPFGTTCYPGSIRLKHCSRKR